jgi:hypothetical protein
VDHNSGEGWAINPKQKCPEERLLSIENPNRRLVRGWRKNVASDKVLSVVERSASNP